MKPEQLQDAVTLLSPDLIEEADRMRHIRPRRLRLRAFGAMAACFALLLLSGIWVRTFLSSGTKETAAIMAQSAPQDPAAAAPREEAALCNEAPAEPLPDTAAGASSNNSTACFAAGISVVLRIEGKDYPLTGEDRLILSRILEELEFRKEDVCECIADITVIAGDSEQYRINLEEGFVRCARGQAGLSAEQIRRIRDILQALTS